MVSNSWVAYRDSQGLGYYMENIHFCYIFVFSWEYVRRIQRSFRATHLNFIDMVDFANFKNIKESYV